MTTNINFAVANVVAATMVLLAGELVPSVAVASDEHDHSSHGAEVLREHEKHDDSEHGHTLLDGADSVSPADGGKPHEGEDDDGQHDDEGHGEHHDEADVVELNRTQTALAQLAIATAGPGTLRQSLSVYGRIEPMPSRTAVVHARYPGQILALSPGIGQYVSRGDVIATVEADDSLRPYKLHAPIDGTVVDRMASAGEATAGRPLLRIADYSKVWAQLAVFPSQASAVEVGQTVMLFGDNVQAEGVIDWIAQAADHGPARSARVVLDNPNGRWVPESTVRAEIVTAVTPVDLVIETPSLQDIEGQRAVFVQDGQRFEAHPLTLGRSDGRLTEVLGGLEPGARYVTTNSYLLKAELEKSSAEHDH